MSDNILVWRDKDGDSYWDASSSEAREWSAREILKQWVAGRYVAAPPTEVPAHYAAPTALCAKYPPARDSELLPGLSLGELTELQGARRVLEHLAERKLQADREWERVTRALGETGGCWKIVKSYRGHEYMTVDEENIQRVDVDHAPLVPAAIEEIVHYAPGAGYA